MPEYIVEQVGDVFNFYLPVESVDINGNSVTVKKLKYSKTVAKVQAEISELEDRITAKQKETTNYVANLNTQKTQKQALLALMV